MDHKLLSVGAFNVFLIVIVTIEITVKQFIFVFNY